MDDNIRSRDRCRLNEQSGSTMSWADNDIVDMVARDGDVDQRFCWIDISCGETIHFDDKGSQSLIGTVAIVSMHRYRQDVPIFSTRRE